MEKTEEGSDGVRILICPGKSTNVFEIYVFVPIDDIGFVAIKLVLRIKDVVNKKHPLYAPSGIYCSSGKPIWVKRPLTH